MKTIHGLMAVVFLILGSFINVGCRASVDVGHPHSKASIHADSAQYVWISNTDDRIIQ